MIQTLKNALQDNPVLKKFIHGLIVHQYQPRLWVKLLWNPFVHKVAWSSVIRNGSRKDIFPFNKFEVGNKTIIESFATVNNAVGDVVIGEGCVIGIGDTLIGPVTIEDKVILAQNIVMSGLNHNYEDVSKPIVDQGVSVAPILIKSNSWIGANSTIVAGVTIGKHCIIGGGSVVTKSIPDYHIAIGNPARLVKKYNFETQQWEKI
ncbi:acyltransferase [Flammeovirga pacifica]|uniref:Acetyltransferase n=1 Tax=Flammeovirga pacifica TaxID=915059 RepID=A0A1S1YT84_FLAPC|nr:acyltransferase [Flammeovirga pacifica]OHX64242.1 acetyltransferase [Flammeovirga pacifica]